MPAAAPDLLAAGLPMGATLIDGGATFRTWAPRASDVYLLVGAETTRSRQPAWAPRGQDRMIQRPDGTWTAFAPDVVDGTPYRYFVIGDDGGGFKRDPWARELGVDPPFPHCDCLARDAGAYRWRAQRYRPPAFSDLVIYQLHVGVFHGLDAAGKDKRPSVAKFLDVALRVGYLRELGVNCIQLLPIQEFPFDNSLGYNNLDFFSPEMAYQIDDDVELARYVPLVGALFAERGATPPSFDELRAGPNQLKALVDLFHLNGLAVIFDLVYNHAGGGFDEESMYFFDRKRKGNQNDSLYFSDREWAGGLSFKYWCPSVQDFLIQNAKFFLTEFRGDGIRYDEVGVIDRHGGWSFCQDMTGTLRNVKPEAIQIAEYWESARELAVLPAPSGLGFDAALGDGLRDALRAALDSANDGANSPVDLRRVGANLSAPNGFDTSWRVVQCLENHDLVYSNRQPHEWKPRVAWLADPSNPRSWYARSRARWATALLLTAPGIPLLFMGQEILEDKNWDDSPRWHPNTLIWWDGLDRDPAMADFLCCTRALLRTRRQHPALRGPTVNHYRVDDGARLLAFHRWLEGSGDDVVVVATLSEGNLHDYELGLPGSGRWREVFNSDAFDSGRGHVTAGNGGAVLADGPPRHGMPASARLTVPANGVLVLAR